MWTAMHENPVPSVDVHSEDWQQTSTFANATLLHELYGCLDVVARNRVGVAVDSWLRAGA
jgi:hypothetical protein